MKNILSLFKKDTAYGDDFYMATNPRFSRYDIGVGTYGDPEIIAWNDETKLTIGKYCSLADNVTIVLGGEHRMDWVTTYPFSELLEEGRSFTGHPATKGDIIIENDVWIGMESLVLSGVTIGSGAAVAARSVVTKSVPPYTIVAGNPARVIRKRFDDSVIEKLLEIAWWDWPTEKIIDALPLLLSPDIHGFIEKYS